MLLQSQSFTYTHPISGRMAGILRIAATGGFRHGLQHDCHEALTYILSIANAEETQLLQQWQCDSGSSPSDSQKYPGVVANNFGIEERIVLTVRAALWLRRCFDFANLFCSARICSVRTCAQGLTWVLSYPFPWNAVLLSPT